LTLRVRILLAFTLTVVVVVGIVAATVSTATRQSFETLDAERTKALVAQFQREFTRRGEEISSRVQGIADAEATLRMALELSRPNADVGLYVNDALGLAKSHRLDFLEFLGDDGAVISSAQWQARFGYKTEWLQGPQAAGVDWNNQGAFLKREELSDGSVTLALIAVRVVPVGEKKLFIVGGRPVDKEFLSSLVLPAGMRALLYRNLGMEFSAALIGAAGPVPTAEKLAPLIELVRGSRTETSQTVQWTSDAASAEGFHAIPLLGREKELLGVLLVGSSRRELVELSNGIRMTAGFVGAAGIALGILLSFWVAARVTRPVRELAAGAQEVASGNLHVQVGERGGGEIAQLAAAFNLMTRQLLEQRDRLLRAERVAAWRELARRLAHELKNPLFPLQITIENLQRARQNGGAEFDEVFRESTATLLAELEKLKTIVARFSDFAKMPAPDLKPVNVNDVVRATLRLFHAQLEAPGQPPIACEDYLQEDIGTIEADAELLGRALQNLILNAMDAMPQGGKLTLRTRRAAQGVVLEVSDTGTGLTHEECERLFTPYYTSKLHGTGLGLAIVQSVVSDHAGKISVESEPGRGTTFRIELPAHGGRPAAPPAQDTSAKEIAPDAAATAPDDHKTQEAVLTALGETESRFTDDWQEKPKPREGE
jgi:signal transduction histidine kinase